MRTWGTNRKGLWAFAYKQSNGTGVMLSVATNGWALSFGLLGRFGAGIGWAYRGHRANFTIQFPPKRS